VSKIQMCMRKFFRFRNWRFKSFIMLEQQNKILISLLACLCHIIWTRVNANNWKIKIQKMIFFLLLMFLLCSCEEPNANIICKLYMCSKRLSAQHALISENMETFSLWCLKKILNGFSCSLTGMNFSSSIHMYA